MVQKMVLEQHQGFKMFQNTGEARRSLHIHKLLLEERPLHLLISEHENHNGTPEKPFDSSQITMYYIIEVMPEREIGLRFESLEMAEVYFNMLKDFDENKDLEVMPCMKGKYSSWFI